MLEDNSLDFEENSFNWSEEERKAYTLVREAELKRLNARGDKLIKNANAEELARTGQLLAEIGRILVSEMLSLRGVNRRQGSRFCTAALFFNFCEEQLPWR